MGRTNQEWKDTPKIDDLWKTPLVKHIKDHLNNQKRYGCKPLKEKIESVREKLTPYIAQDQDTRSEKDDIKVMKTNAKENTRSTRK